MKWFKMQLKEAKIKKEPEIDFSCPYSILGIKRGATEGQIKGAYKARSRIWHPDIAPEETEMFLLLGLAKETLLNPKTRKFYDEYGIFGFDKSGGINIEQKALGDLQNLFIRLIEQAPDIDHLDAVKVMRETVSAGRHKIQDQIHRLKGKNEKFERALKKIKGGKKIVNALKIPIEAAIQQNKKNIQEAKKKELILEKGLELLEGFEFEFGEDHSIMQFNRAVRASQTATSTWGF